MLVQKLQMAIKEGVAVDQKQKPDLNMQHDRQANGNKINEL